MPATYEPIATTTLGSAASTITFSSIGSGYTDLRLVLVGNSTPSTSGFRFKINAATTGYSVTVLSGDGATATSSRSTSQTQGNLAAMQTTPCLLQMDLFSYAGSTNKTILTSWSANSATVDRRVHLYQSTSAITQIELYLTTASQNFAIGTTATLYGIKAA